MKIPLGILALLAIVPAGALAQCPPPGPGAERIGTFANDLGDDSFDYYCAFSAATGAAPDAPADIEAIPLPDDATLYRITVHSIPDTADSPDGFLGSELRFTIHTNYEGKAELQRVIYMAYFADGTTDTFAAVGHEAFPPSDATARIAGDEINSGIQEFSGLEVSDSGELEFFLRVSMNLAEIDEAGHISFPPIMSSAYFEGDFLGHLP